ncbi:rCG60755 [Rattus norvegicus]|uniref:RCG60755 n=1 Tax=Rattus norvegicus TaxID=10116 RepID=A6JKD4_RAT|nr:rCG60755 [Rattus norvegicus]
MCLGVQFLLELSQLGSETGVAQVTVLGLLFLSLCGRRICK